MIEAGCTVIGGHSIRDEETKFGYAVTGMIHPQRVLAKDCAKLGIACSSSIPRHRRDLDSNQKRHCATTWIEAAQSR